MKNTDESALIRFVKQHLDASLPAIPSAQKDRLRAARNRAMLKQRQTSVWGIHLANAGMGSFIHIFSRRALAYFAILLLISGMTSFWHAQSYIGELQEIDSAILIDEMPMAVLTDKGFNEWLQTSVKH